jgi:hypothetical protein
MKHIYDPSFRYTPSHETNIRTTFERLRRERQDEDRAAQGRKPAPAARKVMRLIPDSLKKSLVV